MALKRETIRRKVTEHLKSQGFTYYQGEITPTNGHSKGAYRPLHREATQLELKKHQQWIESTKDRLLPFFADGEDVNPDKIEPRLVHVTQQWQHDLFRFARLTWSLPYSKGYGRRLRFLVMDQSNEKLIGILCLQSPPLTFPSRDKLFSYPDNQKTLLINQTMDIQTLGAVSPYNLLLGGKLVAFAAASNEIRNIYRGKYKNTETKLDKRQIPARLVALTTTSAYGRSSIYNRLKYRGLQIAKPIGYTMGYGSFHFESLYPIFREFLEANGVSTSGGYGKGPRIKWQTIMRATQMLGFTKNLLNHGVKRQVFLFPLVSNLEAYMNGLNKAPRYLDLPFEELAQYWLTRWLLPRSERIVEWKNWKRKAILQRLRI